MNLIGNTILITGGTSGIGLELGKTLLEKGNTVILLGRNVQKLEALKTQGFETICCDLAKVEDIETAVLNIQNNFPKLNMLFNNAGVQYNYRFSEDVIPLQKIGDEIAANFTGQATLTQLLIPVLSSNSNAFIINTTSGLGIFPKSDGIVYSASKAAMRNFTIGLRFLLKPEGIKVLEFMPPVTETSMTEGRNEKKMSAAELVQQILPQLEKERQLLTVPSLRLFRWIAFLAPNLAHLILSKN